MKYTWRVDNFFSHVLIVNSHLLHVEESGTKRILVIIFALLNKDIYSNEYNEWQTLLIQRGVGGKYLLLGRVLVPARDIKIMCVCFLRFPLVRRTRMLPWFSNLKEEQPYEKTTITTRNTIWWKLVQERQYFIYLLTLLCVCLLRIPILRVWFHGIPRSDHAGQSKQNTRTINLRNI